MGSDLEVDVDGLRQWTAALAETAVRLAGALVDGPALGMAGTGWAAAEATDALESAVHRQLTGLGDALADTGRHAAGAAADYQAADARAAARLGTLG